MGLDIRLPLGLLFTAIGALLTAFGLFGDQQIYRRSLNLNVNFWWGALMTIVGAAMLLLSRRHTAAMHSADESIEGNATEAREHTLGLEKEDGN